MEPARDWADEGRTKPMAGLSPPTSAYHCYVAAEAAGGAARMDAEHWIPTPGPTRAAPQ